MESKGECLLSRPLIVSGENQRTSTNAGDIVNVISDGDLGSRQGEDASSASITPALVLATAVVVSGSCVYGSAVSRILFPGYYFASPLSYVGLGVSFCELCYPVTLV